jgi:hypothetical protein
VVASVGDSRAYVLRGDRLVQVTRDQSLASALVAAGHPLGDAETSGAILQALGVGPDCEPSLSLIELRRGDRVLLCSDGLYNLLGDGAIGTIAADARGPQEAAQLLIEAARAAGGSDNISVVLMAVAGERLPLASGDDDLPRFREFDPQREGDPALTSTSRVARRLAARIGLAADGYETPIPATGQHLRVTRPARQRVRAEPIRAVATSPRWPWIVLAASLVSLLALAIAVLR